LFIETNAFPCFDVRDDVDEELTHMKSFITIQVTAKLLTTKTDDVSRAAETGAAMGASVLGTSCSSLPGVDVGDPVTFSSDGADVISGDAFVTSGDGTIIGADVGEEVIPEVGDIVEAVAGGTVGAVVVGDMVGEDVGGMVVSAEGAIVPAPTGVSVNGFTVGFWVGTMGGVEIGGMVSGIGTLGATSVTTSNTKGS
jgi:hypothetical protein